MSSDDNLHTRILREGARAVALRRRVLRLLVKQGPDKGEKRQVSSDRVVIGTHPSCDLVLTDTTVSRQHCEIVLVPRGYLVRDLESTNGIFIDRLRVHEVTIDREVLLQVGNTRVLLTPLDDTVDLPIAAVTRFGALRGQSVAMRRVFERLAQLAPTDLTVLISGESGTGKELAAEALHEASARAQRPFRIVDCGALAGTLIESELYGHVRGAFTGADRTREGAFESAAGGTLFLDEIGELPLELQSRLLGALERKRVQPVGSTESVAVDVRVIAATNRDLRREVSRGTFREDLFFRLAVATVEMPPLRDRPDDIPLYVDEFSEGRGQLEVATLERLRGERWPGNVRELRNAVERALLLGNEDTNAEAASPDEDVQQLVASIDAAVPYKIGKGLLVEKYDRIYLEGLMRRHRGNISQAARAAEIDRVYLVRLLDRFGMRRRGSTP